MMLKLQWGKLGNMYHPFQPPECWGKDNPGTACIHKVLGCGVAWGENRMSHQSDTDPPHREGFKLSWPLPETRLSGPLEEPPFFGRPKGELLGRKKAMSRDCLPSRTPQS